MVSIVILTKNAGPGFRSTLDQIYAQKLSGKYELVVVDSGSTDGTLELIGNYPVRLMTIPPEEFNFGHTRNYGFSLARGDFIVTLSQDVVPCNEQWLEKLVEPFLANDKVAAVQGEVRLPENADIFYWEKRGHFYFTSEVQRWMDEYRCGLSFVNCAIRKSFWQVHPLEPTPFSEDKLYQKAIRDAGCEVAAAPDALCYHGHQYSFSSLLTRLRGEGMGWKCAGLTYSLGDCLRDLLAYKWMVREGARAYLNKELFSLQEVLFPLLRPIYVYLGNRVKVSEK